MADDLKDLKSNVSREIQASENLNPVESIFSCFELPLTSTDDLEKHVESFLKQPLHFNTSVNNIAFIIFKNIIS